MNGIVCIIFCFLFSFNIYCAPKFEYIESNLTPVVNNFLLSKPAQELDWNWEEAIGLHGLVELSPYLTKDLQFRIKNYVKKYHDHWDNQNIDISWADECPSALSAIFLGKNYYQKKDSNFNNVITYLKSAKLNEIGAIDHLGENSFISKVFKPYKNSVWLDSIMMWGNLSLRAGMLLDDGQLIDLALSLPKIFSKYMQDEHSGLFVHSYNYKGDHTYPRQKLFWTRGNGWVVATLADFLELMPRNDQRYNEIKSIFIKLVKGFKNVEMNSGLWRNLYPKGKDNRVDSSGSALVAYGFLKGARLGILDNSYKNIGLNVFTQLNKNLKLTPFGKNLQKVIGPTVPGPRLFYRIIPFQNNSFYGHGTYFLLASELLKNKN
jgi:unsaturated rhamnogalacturonyl hydrolase